MFDLIKTSGKSINRIHNRLSVNTLIYDCTMHICIYLQQSTHIVLEYNSSHIYLIFNFIIRAFCLMQLLLFSKIVSRYINNCISAICVAKKKLRGSFFFHGFLASCRVPGAMGCYYNKHNTFILYVLYARVYIHYAYIKLYFYRQSFTFRYYAIRG